MQYDADGEQWDHVERAVTPGRWSDKRWHVRNALPAPGVNDNDQIELFVPGMIMTIDHPELEEEKFVRMFAPLAPMPRPATTNASNILIPMRIPAGTGGHRVANFMSTSK